jgi:cag pathogenicity island protein 24
MKYTRLTKEQFETLHEEFTRFLASQSITADDWDKLKAEKPNVAEDELDVFSDLIWEGTLNNVQFLENWSEQQVFLFQFNKNNIHLIAVKISVPTTNLLTKEGLHWLEENIAEDEVEIFEAEKEYTVEPNLEKFKFIQEGAIITEGGFYNTLNKLLK